MWPTVFTLTVVAVVHLLAPRMERQNGGMYPDWGGAFFQLLAYSFALIVSLLAWLIWALV
ncbi:hypothetical protein [Kaistia terrae]|uniref:Uncharacterized protein n=2 Tax=Kaistia terrae TaxID=537017 RepID=A0ABW0Q2I0_9HYPH